MHDILQCLKSLKFIEKVSGKRNTFEDDIFFDFVNNYLFIKMKFELENKVSHHTEKYKEPAENKDVNPVDLKYVKVQVIKFKD